MFDSIDDHTRLGMLQSRSGQNKGKILLRRETTKD